jgi:hypothetical protein
MKKVLMIVLLLFSCDSDFNQGFRTGDYVLVGGRHYGVVVSAHNGGCHPRLFNGFMDR